MKGISWLRLALLGLVAVVALAGSGCGSAATSSEDDDDDRQVSASSPDAGHTGDTTCFMPLDTAQQQEMQTYAAQPGNAELANGVQSVCVLEQDSDGTYVEHYYSREENNFNLFLMYALLSKHSGPLMAYGLVAGQITPMEYILLSTLVCIGNDGRTYHPYTKHSDNSWTRQKHSLSYKVAKVRYGSAPPVKRVAGYKAPPGYGQKSVLPGVTKPRREVGVPNTTAKTPSTPKATTPSTPKQSTPTVNTPKPTAPKPPAGTVKPTAPKPPTYQPPKPVNPVPKPPIKTK